MATKSTIEWTEMTWNPVTGCTKVSQGCKHCYAARMANRLQAMGSKRYANAFAVTLHRDLLEVPKRWKRPRTIFVNSMSDLFHEDIPDTFIQQVFATMAQCPQHTFQVLTKRTERLRSLAGSLAWTKNIWMGVSVENESVLFRVDDLRKVPAKTRFLSCEPLLGPLRDFELSGIHWVIVGGESGPDSRCMSREWVEGLRIKCSVEGVPFFFKQWGGVAKKRSGRELNGRTYDEMPDLAREQGYVQIEAAWQPPQAPS